MKNIKSFIKRNRFIIISFLAVILIVAFVELGMGRSFFGPDGKFGWWDGNIWGNENSQRVADVYSFTHIIHGLVFYPFLWIVVRRFPARYRFLAALILEGAWEILENSSFIINRYREATISQTYFGDSILNSCSDVVMMSIGFLIAYRLRPWLSVLIVICIELVLLLWVRDNLSTNIIMLIHPIDALKTWQSAIQPHF
ncbi:MAG: DUF2585 family protein [bacterium]|nr:DUF2585 family protein [bacterium]